MRRHITTGLLLLVLVSVTLRLTPAAAQTSEQQRADARFVSTPFRNTFLFTGPGETYTLTHVVVPGQRVEVLERNHTGTWVFVQVLDDGGAVEFDGWMISGFLEGTRDGLDFRDVPVNAELTDAVPENATNPQLRALYSTPILPPLDALRDSLADIYARGQALGNHSHVVTKVGDSVTANVFYLLPMARDDNILGPYAYLSETVEFFGTGVSESLAARLAMSSFIVLDPFWADSDLCQPNESPLACEYRVRQPSVAFIMFGPNDVRKISVEEYSANLTVIVEASLERGIIPVLVTFSSDPDDAYYQRSILFNNALIAVGGALDVPVLNFWSASRILPDYGLDGDLIHLTNSGYEYLRYDAGYEARAGIPLLNLLSIRVLHDLRLMLEMDR